MRVAMKKQQSKNIIFSIDMKVQGSKDTKDNVSGPSDDGMNKRGSQINLMQINYKKKQPKSIRRNHIDKLTELYKQPEGSIEAYSKTQALRIQNSQKAQKKMKKLREIMKKPDIQRNKIPITSSSFDADREKTQEEEQIIVYQQQSERS